MSQRQRSRISAPVGRAVKNGPVTRIASSFFRATIGTNQSEKPAWAPSTRYMSSPNIRQTTSVVLVSFALDAMLQLELDHVGCGVDRSPLFSIQQSCAHPQLLEHIGERRSEKRVRAHHGTAV